MERIQRVVAFLGIIFCALALFVPAAANPYSRGPQYTITQSPEHKQPYIEVRNATYHGSGPREEARAMCSVKTQEVNATANATITRRLHGVVTSRELHSSIQRLEVIIYGQMQQLWQSLDALRLQIAGAPRVPFPDRRSSVQKYWRRKKSMKSIDAKTWVPHVFGSIDKYLHSQAAADCNI